MNEINKSACQGYLSNGITLSSHLTKEQKDEIWADYWF
jgi:hypothetical protein